MARNSKPKLKELRKGKKYFVAGDPCPMVGIYPGCFPQEGPDGHHHLFIYRGAPDSGVWVGNRLGGIENYSRQREIEIDEFAARWLEKH